MIVFMLAAGLGTRLRPVTYVHPKPCIPFLNVPMGLYNFRFLNSIPVQQLIVNTHHLPEQVEKMYREQPYYMREIEFSNETEKILGSAGGLKKASALFKRTAIDDSTVLLMNADEILFNIPDDFLLKAYQQHINERNLATLVVMKHPEAGRKFGAIWADGSHVKLIGKVAPEGVSTPYHYIGYIFFDKRILSMIPDNEETNIFYDLLKFKLDVEKVQIHEINGQWYETGNPEDLLLASKEVLKNLDSKTLDFINQYDESSLVQNTHGLSLLSRRYENFDRSLLSGFNMISKTTNPDFVKKLGSLQDSIVFESSIISA